MTCHQAFSRQHSWVKYVFKPLTRIQGRDMAGTYIILTNPPNEDARITDLSMHTMVCVCSLPVQVSCGADL